MSGQAWIVKTKDQLEIALDAIGDGWDWATPLQLKWKKHTESRSLSANALYWVWLGTMAKHYSQGAHSYTGDEMHDLMRHKFLGYTDVTVGKTVIRDQLKSTANMEVPEFCYYMEQIDAWAAENSVLLPRPEDSEYSKYKEANR